jgi:hypothetical protein
MAINSRKFLKNYGIKGKILKSTISRIAIIGSTILAMTEITWYVIYIYLPPTPLQLTEIIKQIKPTDVITLYLGIAVVVIGFAQWRAVRWETAMEKYYDRRELANRRLEAIVQCAAADKDPYKKYEKAGLTVFDCWVFSEVDELEYAIDKYRIGHMTVDQVCRAVRMFKVFCENDPIFNRNAVAFANNGAYKPVTKEVIERIHREVSVEQSREALRHT